MANRSRFPQSRRAEKLLYDVCDMEGMGGRTGANCHCAESASTLHTARKTDPGTRTVSRSIPIPGNGSYRITEEVSTPTGYAPGLNRAYGNYGVDERTKVRDTSPREER